MRPSRNHLRADCAIERRRLRLGRSVRNHTQAKSQQTMKNMIKSLAVMTAIVGLAASAFAGECCVKAAKAAKAGKTCEKCEKDSCCKEAVKKVGKDAKACEKCAAKEKK